MLHRLESAFAQACRATGRLSLILVKRRTRPSELDELAALLEDAALTLRNAAKNFGIR